ncbi:hypothetical protein MMMDOFMJ_3092 [Methylobacterium gnaphalii]|nr:hypothetical protein MMMDOFMJ_3092 [Methylobacterium gnaphalii]
MPEAVDVMDHNPACGTSPNTLVTIRNAGGRRSRFWTPSVAMSPVALGLGILAVGVPPCTCAPAGSDPM